MCVRSLAWYVRAFAVRVLCVCVCVCGCVLCVCAVCVLVVLHTCDCTVRLYIVCVRARWKRCMRVLDPRRIWMCVREWDRERRRRGGSTPGKGAQEGEGEAPPELARSSPSLSGGARKQAMRMRDNRRQSLRKMAPRPFIRGHQRATRPRKGTHPLPPSAAAPRAPLSGARFRLESLQVKRQLQCLAQDALAQSLALVAE